MKKRGNSQSTTQFLNFINKGWDFKNVDDDIVQQINHLQTKDSTKRFFINNLKELKEF